MLVEKRTSKLVHWAAGGLIRAWRNQQGMKLVAERMEAAYSKAPAKWPIQATLGILPRINWNSERTFGGLIYADEAVNRNFTIWPGRILGGSQNTRPLRKDVEMRMTSP